MELLERAGESVHVRLPDGREGWLRALYVSGNAPLRPRLQQSEAEVTRAEGRGEPSGGAGERRGEPERQRAAGRGRTGQRRGPCERRARSGSSAPRPTAPRAASGRGLCGCMLLGLLLGFALGWRMLDRSIRKKYGGLKID